MQKEARQTILIVVLGILVVFALGYLFYQSGQMEMPESYATATAVLSSPTGKTVGKITFQQSENGVLIKAEAHSLSPGGHALSIHPVGSCSPDIRTAGRQINSTGDEQGLVSDPATNNPQGDDLPNIYAGADGIARADFFSSGITMEQDAKGSVFDADGSAVIVHERPDPYVEPEPDMGSRVACGIIEPGKMKISQM